MTGKFYQLRKIIRAELLKIFAHIVDKLEWIQDVTIFQLGIHFP